MRDSEYTYERDIGAMRRGLTILAIALGVVLVIVAAGVWFFGTHVVVDSQIYSRMEEVLDLRGEGIAIERYEALKEKMPDQYIRWDVPFQNGYHDNEVTELTVEAISDDDIKLLPYFTKLKTIHAEDCEDYEQLLKLQAQRPDLDVLYTVTIDGKDYGKETESLSVTHLTEEDVALTDYLPLLKKVDGTACQDYAQLAALQQRHPECSVEYTVRIADQEYSLDTKSLELTNLDISQLVDRLAYLPQMKTIHLTDPIGDAETMQTLRSTYPNVTITSEMVGVVVSEDGKEVDLTGVKLEKIEDVDKYMPFYPDAERVYLGMPEFDNDTIAAFRETKRQDYKVVWTVMCGTIPVRTDEIFFQPIQHYVYYFFDEDTVNLRYCEDMICIDLGHMSLHNCDFVLGMPNLKYLVLSWTFIEDITPLASCKNLIWLEVFAMPIKDLSPLKGCTALEDLNLGRTRGDRSIIAEMTWLKNLHWYETGYNDLMMLQEAMPDTDVTTVITAWRQLPNYFAHRDILGMPYMT